MGTDSLTEPSPSPGWLTYAAWLLGLAVASAAMLPWRDVLDKTHVTLAFLLLALAASATAGKRVGLAVAVAAFFAFNFLFLPPFYRLTLANPFDWFVLAAFLVVAAVAAHLLDRSQGQAREARARSAEVGHLAALGAEALNAARADLAIARVADVIRDTMGVASCRIHDARSADVAEALVRATLDQGAAFSVLADGTTRATRPTDGTTGEWRFGDPPPGQRFFLPLRVHDRTVGVLELADPAGVSLDESQRRLLAAMSWYAALGVERARLEDDARRVDELRAADRVKDALLASVSHDLRTPLTTIKALAVGLGDLGDERAEIIGQEADRLNRMVGDLLDLSRISAGGLRPNVEAVPVDDLVSAAVQQVEGALGGRRLDVSLGPEGGLLVGRFDLTHSIRILVNLIENARKHAPVDSPIEVRVAREDGWICIHVLDRGPGVAPGEVDRLFRPLYRTQSAQGAAAGLGLAIAREFAQAQGGQVTYAPRPGGGSVFTLRLPAVDLAQAG